MANRKRGAAVRQERKDKADARQRQRDELTAAEQIAVLDARLGAGVGAERERARLQALIE